MPILAGIVFIATGLAFMLFGLFLFYAFLPLLFAFIGFDVGVLIGRRLTGEIGLVTILLGMGLAGILAVLSYSLEPYRRIMLGASSGILVGLSVAAGLGVEGWFVGVLNVFLIIICGVIGGLFTLVFFDVFVIFASAFAGASLAVAGGHLLLRGTLHEASSGLWSAALVLILAAVGIAWQLSNMPKLVQWLPGVPQVPGAPERPQDKSRPM